MDLTIEGRVYLNGNLTNCCIGIEKGKISKISKILKSENHMNFGNNLIIPAGIDIHVHFRDPGMTHKGDFLTESISAAFGGISCVFDMPNTIPQTSTVKNLKDKIRIAEEKAFVDFGLYSAITNDNINNISEIIKYCNGFKLFMGESTNSMLLDKKNLSNLKNLNLANKPILVHAEDKECIDKNKFIERNLIDHIKSRPSDCEKKAIIDLMYYLRDSNFKIHICHVSSSDGVKTINKFNNITCGVTPHHLFLNIENQKSNQTFLKTNPPIRRRIEREYLFKCIQNNIINVIESDHAPHTYDEKNMDFNEAPSGIPGVETMMPIFLFLAQKGRLSINKIVELLCEKPAELLNIPKGKIEVGRDADFIVVDLKKIVKIHQEELHYKCGWTPFENFQAVFPKHLFIRGKNLIKDNVLISKKGFGTFVGG